MRVVCELQDRHNGNILLDDVGHLIHIDFGFMLSNSPGSVNFEAAPFKLTRELLEVMDSSSEGHPSEMFDYYKVTHSPAPPQQCVSQGMLCRSTTLVSSMQSTAFLVWAAHHQSDFVVS